MRTRTSTRDPRRKPDLVEKGIFVRMPPHDPLEDLGKVVKLGDLKWERYKPVIEAIEGRGNLPLDREMITPRDMAEAKQLEKVYP